MDPKELTFPRLKGAPSLGSFSEPIQAVFRILWALLSTDGVLPGKEKRQFDRFIEPTKKAMEEYHVLYKGIFADARRALRAEFNKRYQFRDFKDVNDGEVIKPAIELIDERRKKDEYSRDIFRDNIRAFLRAIDVEEYRNFITACSDYFVLEPFVNTDLNDLRNGAKANRILERGGQEVYDTPASSVIRYLRKENNCQEADQMLNSCEIYLNEKHYNILCLYWGIEKGRPIF